MSCMKTFLFFFLVAFILYGCGKSENSSVKIDLEDIENRVSINPGTTNATRDLVAANRLIISENYLGEIQLPFPYEEMTASLAKVFGPYSVTKEVGQQDGPDFVVYSIKERGLEQLYFEMDWEDPNVLNSVYIKGLFVKDEYGLSVGDSYKRIKQLRGGEIKIYSNYHFHTYAYFDDSNIMYEISTDSVTPNSVDLENTQFSSEQLENWRIQHIIWRDQHKANPF